MGTARANADNGFRRRTLRAAVGTNTFLVGVLHMINWRVRIKNKAFWLALIPAALLLVQVVLAPFGYQWDYGVLNQQLAAIINALFAVLSIFLSCFS